MVDQIFSSPDSLVPVLGFGSSGPAQVLMGRMLTWAGSPTWTNTVDVLGTVLVNLPLVESAAATLVAPCTVLLAKIGPNYIILGRIRRP